MGFLGFAQRVLFISATDVRSFVEPHLVLYLGPNRELSGLITALIWLERMIFTMPKRLWTVRPILSTPKHSEMKPRREYYGAGHISQGVLSAAVPSQGNDMSNINHGSCAQSSSHLHTSGPQSTYCLHI